jgi:hypothetical protein
MLGSTTHAEKKNRPERLADRQTAISHVSTCVVERDTSVVVPASCHPPNNLLQKPFERSASSSSRNRRASSCASSRSWMNCSASCWASSVLSCSWAARSLSRERSSSNRSLSSRFVLSALSVSSRRPSKRLSSRSRLVVPIYPFAGIRGRFSHPSRGLLSCAAVPEVMNRIPE